MKPGKLANERDQETIEREIEVDEQLGRLDMRTRKSRASMAPAFVPVSAQNLEQSMRSRPSVRMPFYYRLLHRRRVAEMCQLLVGESVKKVNNMHLQNVVMQLRKVCSHPFGAVPNNAAFLFDRPMDERTYQPVVDKQLVDAGGKMMVLEWLLDELFARGHKVLLVFSQFVTMVDVIEVRTITSLPTGSAFVSFTHVWMMMPNCI